MVLVASGYFALIAGTAAVLGSVFAVPGTPLASSQVPTGTVVYEAGVANGFAGWFPRSSLPGDWRIDGDVVAYDGLRPTLAPPVFPLYTQDYFVEGEIRSSPQAYGHFSLVVRQATAIEYQAAVFDGQVAILDVGGPFYWGPPRTLAQAPFEPDGSWHTYRFEANGTRLSFAIDDVLVVEAMGATRGISSPNLPRVNYSGLRAEGIPINVRRYRVVAVGADASTPPSWLAGFAKREASVPSCSHPSCSTLSATRSWP